MTTPIKFFLPYVYYMLVGRPCSSSLYSSSSYVVPGKSLRGNIEYDSDDRECPNSINSVFCCILLGLGFYGDSTGKKFSGLVGFRDRSITRHPVSLHSSSPPTQHPVKCSTNLLISSTQEYI